MRWLGSWRDAKRVLAEAAAIIAEDKRPPQASPPAAGAAPAPGTHVPPGATSAEPPTALPGAGLTAEEAVQLARIQAIRQHAQPAQAQSGQIIADGLRVRFAGLDDATLGVLVTDLLGWIEAMWHGIPDSDHAMRCVVDAFGLAAEELTRLARNEGIPR